MAGEKGEPHQDLAREGEGRNGLKGLPEPKEEQFNLNSPSQDFSTPSKGQWVGGRRKETGHLARESCSERSEPVSTSAKVVGDWEGFNRLRIFDSTR